MRRGAIDGLTGNDQRVTGKCRGIDTLAFRGGGNCKDLRCTEYLPEALILAEIECLAPSVIEFGDNDWTSVGEAKFIADKGRNAPRVGYARMVKKVTSIEGGVADKLKNAAVYLVGPGFGNYVGEAGSSVTNFCGHHP